MFGKCIFCVFGKTGEVEMKANTVLLVSFLKKQKYVILSGRCVDLVGPLYSLEFIMMLSLCFRLIFDK